jgi:hypothetical protein
MAEPEHAIKINQADPRQVLSSTNPVSRCDPGKLGCQVDRSVIAEDRQ